MPVLSPDVALRRLFSRCVLNGQCLEWTGMVQHKGYGMVRFGGKMRSIHRVVYEMQVGGIPEGMHVLHRCDNPKCCNKEHLFLGTNAENISDKVKKDRSGKKINTAQAKKILELLSLDAYTHKSIARLFGLHPSTISRIGLGQKWAHVHNIGGTDS